MAITIQSLVKLFVPYMNTNVKVSTTPLSQALNRRFSDFEYEDSVEDTSEINNAIGKILLNTVETKAQLYQLIDTVKDIDSATYIVDSIIDDCFNSVDTEQPFEVLVSGNHYDTLEAQKICDDFTAKFNIHQLFLDMIGDLITYGEYYLHTIPRKGFGIVEINDTVDCKNVISIYKNYRLIEHIGFVNDNVFANTAYNAATADIMRIHKDLLTHFILDARKIRLRIDRNSSLLALPDIIRVGRSVLYPVISLLKRSNILDLAIMSKDLRAALLPLLVSLSMPGVTTPGDAISAARKWEKYFIDNTNLASLAEDGNLDKRMIFNNVGRIKVVPSFQDGKAALAKMDIDAGGDTSSIQTNRDNTEKRINQVIGLPNADENASRFDILKTKSRYSKKLVDIQRSSANGLRNLYYKNLLYKGIYIKEENIQIKFKSLVNPDAFEEAENMLSLVSAMQDFLDFVNSCANSENLNIGVNTTNLIKTFDTLLGNRYVNLNKMLYNKNNINDILANQNAAKPSDASVDSDIDRPFNDNTSIDEPEFEEPADFENSEPEVEEPTVEEPEVEEPTTEEPEAEA